ncbi:MAG: HAMP domain-containing sensor histidine kinase [Eubacteriales bacterium]|nr:HAMP domain-containing sensor histidine kinase [Eubacteriales bacterium]
MKKPGRSLRAQIAGSFIGLLLLALLMIVAINGFFLEKYYISRKADALKIAFEILKKYETASSAEEISQEWLSESSKQNLSWVIVSEEQEWKIIAGYGFKNDINVMSGRLFGYTHNLETSEDVDKRFELLEKNDDCIIQKSKESVMGVEYMEIWGVFPRGAYCMVRTPLESIQESAAISNSFYFFVGVGIIALSGLCIWLITNRITKPISELADLSLRMANLDFEARYKSSINNEIDVLGQNFNKMSKELENTISELKTANAELQKDIENKIRMDEQRREFLGNVSHELKTPIALIQGYAEGLKENIFDDDAESQEFYCDVIIDEAAKMNKLVRSLLTLNQLESGQDAVEMSRFNLVELIQGVIQKSSIMIQQSEAKVFFDEKEPVYVWADEFKIEEVITNYFTNALNHLDGDREIEIKLERGSVLKVSVFNTGSPIPEADIPNLWNKFYKVDKAHTREYGGSGIGLSIVKAVMDSHGQSCGVTNYENGVSFWFTLDIEKH